MSKSSVSGLQLGGIVLLTVSVMALGALELAHATWVAYGTHEATMGTDTYGMDDMFTVDGNGTASTNVRVRCNPCPTCIILPQVNYSWVATWKDGESQTVGTSQSSGGVQHECACPSSAFAVDCANVPEAESVYIAVTVTCSCCDKQGWVWSESQEDEFWSTPPVGLDGSLE